MSYVGQKDTLLIQKTMGTVKNTLRLLFMSDVGPKILVLTGLYTDNTLDCLYPSL